MVREHAVPSVAFRKTEIRDKNKDETDLLNDSSNEWKTVFVFSCWPSFFSDDPIKFFMSTGLYFRVGWNQSKEPLNDPRGLSHNIKLTLFESDSIYITHGMNTSKSKDGSKHTQVFPIEFLFFLRLNERFGKTVRHVLACVHSRFDSKNHRAVHFDQVRMQFLAPRSRRGGDPLKRLNEVDDVRPGT